MIDYQINLVMPETYEYKIQKFEPSGNVVFQCGNPTREVVRFCEDGRVLWNGVEIYSEQEFKEAMIELLMLWKRGL